MLKNILSTSEIKELKTINQKDGIYGLQEKMYEDTKLFNKLEKHYRDEIPYEWQNGDMGASQDWVSMQTLPRDLKFYE